MADTVVVSDAPAEQGAPTMTSSTPLARLLASSWPGDSQMHAWSPNAARTREALP
jgi:hypothetical protein